MRRKPDPAQIDRIRPIYRSLLEEEARHPDRKLGMQAAGALLERMLDEKKVSYDEFAFAL
jgi:hypothetical protein